MGCKKASSHPFKRTYLPATYTIRKVVDNAPATFQGNGQLLKELH